MQRKYVFPERRRRSSAGANAHRMSREARSEVVHGNTLYVADPGQSMVLSYELLELLHERRRGDCFLSIAFHAFDGPFSGVSTQCLERAGLRRYDLVVHEHGGRDHLIAMNERKAISGVRPAIRARWECLRGEAR